MTYFGFRQKRKQDQAVVIRHGKKIKSVVANTVQKRLEVERVKQFDEDAKLESFLTQDDFVEYLRDSVRSAPVIPIQSGWEQKIYSVWHLSIFTISQIAASIIIYWLLFSDDYEKTERSSSRVIQSFEKRSPPEV